MNHAVLTLVASLAFSVSAHSASANTPERCAAMTNPNERLACYDDLFVVRETPVQQGTWTVSEERSALDDSRRVVLRVESEDLLRGRFGRMERASLIIRCEQNTTSAFVNFGGHFMASIQGYGRVDYRVDNQPARNVNMQESTNNQALGLWRGGTSIPFIRQLFGGQRLLVRATPFNESRVEATFLIGGIEEAIQPLRSACNW